MVLFEANCNKMFLLVYKLRKFSYCTNRESGLDLDTAMALRRIQTTEKIGGRITYLLLLAERLTITYN